MAALDRMTNRHLAVGLDVDGEVLASAPVSPALDRDPATGQNRRPVDLTVHREGVVVDVRILRPGEAGYLLSKKRELIERAQAELERRAALN